MHTPPFSTWYSFTKIPENECININTNSSTEKYFYLSKTLYQWDIEFNKPLSYSKFQSLIKKKLGNAKLIYVDNVLYTWKCDNEHYIKKSNMYEEWILFKEGNVYEEWNWCDPTRHDNTEIVYSLEDNWEWWYQIIRIIWNNEEKEIITDIGKINNFEFFRALILTILLETFMLFFICKLFFKKDEIKNWKIILTWIVASSVTLPILRFVLPNILQNWTVFAIIGEVFVTIVEIFIIKYMLNIKRWKAIIASITCNLFSVLIWLFL